MKELSDFLSISEKDLWNREEGNPGCRERKYKKLPAELKESYRWSESIDSRLTKIYSDLVSLEKMMHYKHSIIDILRTIAPYINDEQGRRLTLVEQCRKRWLRHAANSSHSDSYNGKYDDEDE